MKYRPDIDGLRAIAIMPVVLFHAGLSAVSGGYVGVDVFFVISGYLITGIIHDDLEAGRFSVLSFYDRRIRRILPALVVTLVLTWIAALVLFLPPYFVDFSKSLFASATFISNLYFWLYSGYFENRAQLRPLLHTWSLAVEEQFYIFMPLALFVVHRVFGKRWLGVLGPAALASFALSVHAMQVAPTANFFLLPTRAWELFLGAALALRPPQPLRHRWMRELAALSGFVLIVWAAFTYTDTTPFPGFTALPPCVGAALLIYVGGRGGSVTGRILSLPPIVYVGLISYSLYLVHWPLAVFTRYYTLQPPSVWSVTFILACSFALAALFHRVVERPFRGPRMPMPRLRLFLFAGATLVGLACLGILGIAFQGFPQRFPTFHFPEGDRASGWREGKCYLDGGAGFQRWRAEDCTIADGGGEGVLLWGDSFAAHYAPGVSANADATHYRIYLYAAAGCPPVVSYHSYAQPECQAFNQHALDIIKTLNVRRVILAAQWVDLQRRGLDELRSTMKALHSAGVETFVIGQSPMFLTDVAVIAFRTGGAGNATDWWPISFDYNLNARLRTEAPDAVFVDPVDRLCRGKMCPYRTNGEFLYSDYGHFTPFGSAAAVRAYVPIFDAQ
jgi:peptidoglycan/LPS O-acetylase OafA/YrhL